MYGYTTAFPFSDDKYISCCTPWLPWITLLWTFIYKLWCTCTFLFPLELLYRILTVFTFLRPTKLFSKVTVPFYILTSNVWGFQFLYILTTTYQNSSFILLRQPHGSEVVSYCGFDLNFLNDFWLFVDFLGNNLYSGSLPIFLKNWFLFAYSKCKPLLRYMICKYFLLFILSFQLLDSFIWNF